MFVYQIILGGPAATFELYDAQFFKKFREQNLVSVSMEYAQVILTLLRYDCDMIVYNIVFIYHRMVISVLLKHCLIVMVTPYYYIGELMMSILIAIIMILHYLFRLAILANFPETLDPNIYSYLLPEIELV